MKRATRTTDSIPGWSCTCALSLLALGVCLSSGCEGPEPSQPLDKHTPSARVTLGNIHHIEARGSEGDDRQHEGGSITWTFESGEQLELTTFLIVVSDIELHACADAGTKGQGALLDLLIPSAHAHVPSSATRLGTPFIADLLSKPGRANILGEVAPPPMRYCDMYMVVAPADDDVINLTEVATEELEGKSAMLSGAWRPSAESEWERFDHTFSFKRLDKIELIDPKSGSKPLVLEDKGSAFLLLDAKLARALVKEPSALKEKASALALVEHVLSQTTIYRPPARKEK